MTMIIGYHRKSLVFFLNFLSQISYQLRLNHSNLLLNTLFGTNDHLSLNHWSFKTMIWTLIYCPDNFLKLF
jgi:hypothetical protein